MPCIDIDAYSTIILGACRACLGGAWASCICWSNHWLILKGSRSMCDHKKIHSVHSIHRNYWWVRPGYDDTRDKHATHKLVKHMLQVVEVALTDGSTLTIFFYIRYRSPPSRCCEKLESSDFDTGTVSQATKTNGIDRLPCGYVYRSSHWIGKSVSSLRPCCRHRWVRLSMVHVFNSWLVLN